MTVAKLVVDAGCGRGAWLRVFGQNGVTDYLGIDGACRQAYRGGKEITFAPLFPMRRAVELA